MSAELADARLEREIKKAQEEMDTAAERRDPIAGRAAWLKLKELVAQRSEDQIEKMERQRGLQ